MEDSPEHAGPQARSAPAAQSGSRDRLVRAIGVFKLVKAAVLAPLGAAALLGVPERVIHSGVRALAWSGAMSAHHVVRSAIARLQALNDHDMHELGGALLAYAAVFILEGVGLLRRRRWAEWLTVVVTASFIPFEIYELARRPGAGKVIALVLNAAIAAYLAWRRLREHAAAHPRARSRFRPA